MAKESKNPHSRARGMTQISISLPKRLVDKIDALAKKTKRSRSNYVSYVFENLADANTEVSFAQPVEHKPVIQ